jgi:flagellar basal body-associated protein FliL
MYDHYDEYEPGSGKDEIDGFGVFGIILACVYFVFVVFMMVITFIFIKNRNRDRDWRSFHVESDPEPDNEGHEEDPAGKNMNDGKESS